MKTIEVTIKLDPVNDGAEINPTKITKKEEMSRTLLKQSFCVLLKLN